MSRVKRTLIGVGVAAAFGVPLSFVGLANGAGKIQIAEFYYNPSPYGIASVNGAEQAAGRLGVQLTTFDGNNNPQLQDTQVQDATTTGKYKAFWVWALDGVGIKPFLQKAEAKGIKVATADYTLGTLQQELTLKKTPGLVTTVGQSIGPESTAMEATIKAACAKQVGAGKPCTVAFMPGLANYPTDTIRINSMTTYFKGSNVTFNLMPPCNYDQPTAQSVALSYFNANKNSNVFATFGDQCAAGAETAMKQDSLTPGKDIQVIGYGGTAEFLGQVKSGAAFATLGLYPTAESKLGIQYLVQALKGKKVPNPVNIIGPNRPLVINKAFLKSHPHYQADWSLQG